MAQKELLLIGNDSATTKFLVFRKERSQYYVRYKPAKILALDISDVSVGQMRTISVGIVPQTH